MKTLLSEIRPAIMATLVLAAVTCGVYPLIVTGLAQTFFKDKAHGSLITNQAGVIIGSTLIGQNFIGERYFHPRPSAAGNGYDAASSGGSNLGPTSQKLHDAIKERIIVYRTLNNIETSVPIPADAVTASGSGLDPHISPRNASLQAPRIAKVRNLSLDKVKELISANIERPDWNILGNAKVNVLKLNMALDDVERVFQPVSPMQK